MKRIIYLSTAGVLVFTLACGGNTETLETEQTQEGVEEAAVEVESSPAEIEKEVGDDANEREIKIAELPLPVVTAITSAYPDYTIDEADEITNEDGSLTYEVELEMGDSELEVIYAANGHFLGLEEDDGDEDEGDDEEDDD